MKAIVATLIAALSALATSATTSAPLLDVERGGTVSIVGQTPPLAPEAQRLAPVVQPTVEPTIDPTIVDTTIVDTTIVDTTIVEPTIVDTTVDTGSAADCAAGDANDDASTGQDAASTSTTTLGC